MHRYYKDDRFHSHVMTIYTMLPFRREDLPVLTLLSFVLKNRARGYPHQHQIIAASENLYALDLSFSHFFNKDNLVFYVTFNVVDEKLVLDDDLYQKAIDFIYLLAFDYYLPRYNERLIAEQKEIVTNLLFELENRPSYIASQGFYKALDDNWLLSIPNYGTVDEIHRVTKSDLIDLHQRIIKAPKAYIGVGPGEEKKIKKALNKYFVFHGQLPLYQHYQRQNSDVIEVIQEKEIQQSRIMMGYRLNEECNYYEAQLLSALIGELGISRLFVEVREKRGLCYSISSSLNAYNQMLFIAAGVSTSRLDEAQDAIREVIAHLHFSHLEVKKAKSLIKSSLLSNSDHNLGIMQMMVRNLRSGDLHFDIERLIAGYEQVTPKRLNLLARHLIYQGSYVLKGVIHS